MNYEVLTQIFAGLAVFWGFATSAVVGAAFHTAGEPGYPVIRNVATMMVIAELLFICGLIICGALS